MIHGIGNDIVEVERIASAMRRHGDRFLTRIFSAEEIRYCIKFRDAPAHFAGRFAAKEAIVKALGTGFQFGITWQDVQILNNAHGKPEVILSENVREISLVDQCLITISHCRNFATATALAFSRS